MSPRKPMITCPQCGEEFEVIGQHWNRSSECDYPKLTDKQKEIIVGLLMGDGTLEERNPNQKCRLKVDMITKPYLEYLSDVFGLLSTKVTLKRTADEGASQDKKNGFNLKAHSDNYHDLYRWRLRSHPKLDDFVSWYPSGNKVWPKDIELTPTTLKHYFVGDGTIEYNIEPYIRMAMSNERNNKDKVEEMFKNVGLPRPNRWDEGRRKDGSHTCSARWTVEQSKELWRYMGPPLPGFSYKWPREFKNHT